METTITATELARSLSDVLSRVRYKGERFLITRNGEPLGALGPVEPAKKEMPLGEFLAFLKENWPDDKFAEDLEAIHSLQQPARMPEWE